MEGAGFLSPISGAVHVPRPIAGQSSNFSPCGPSSFHLSRVCFHHAVDH